VTSGTLAVDVSEVHVPHPLHLGNASDAELMHRIQLDDADALGLLFDRHCTKAYGLARAMCGQPDTAEDVVQEAFIAIWRGRSTYAAQAEGVAAWAMAIVRHRAIDAYRRDRVRERGRDDTAVLEHRAAGGDLALEACARDEAAHLRGLLGQLPPRQRDVIALAFYGELTQREIALHLDIPLGTVKGRMRLGLRKLSDDLSRPLVLAG
jgi:RNA polymerase sigma-70 factor (ECF subfamily)